MAPKLKTRARASGAVGRVAKLARVLLADDHAAILAQTINLLAGGEFKIVGSVANSVDLIKAVARLDPDVVVLAITMPGLNGIEAARQLKRSGCRAKLVFLSAYADPDYARAGMAAGGTAYVVKARLVSDLIPAIHEALAGHRFVSPTISLKENL